jgi:hypothetical protein
MPVGSGCRKRADYRAQRFGTKEQEADGDCHKDLAEFSAFEGSLSGYDACFFCLGVSSAGLSEQEYVHVTYDIATAAAQTLVKLNPGMTFVFISGSGADSTEQGRTMWARVKGKTENALLRVPFKAVYVIRPAFIQPLHGIESRTKIYRAMYAVMAPLYPIWKTLLPKYVTTTEELGRAMIAIAKRGAAKHLLESADIGSVV